MMTLLLDGRAYPAATLAKAAGIGRPAASAHLQQLVSAGFIEVHQQGRYRYHRLTRAEVAQALEALAAIAPPVPVRSLRQSNAARHLAAARSCYDHLAGRAGVALRQVVLDHGVITPVAGADFEVSAVGVERLAAVGVDPVALAQQRRRLVRDCLDWTERVPHLAGALPAALLLSLVDRGWVRRRAGRRVDVTAAGWERVQAELGCVGACHPAASFLDT